MAAAFSPRFEVLAFDYRGLGRSSEVVGAYTMAECAADARAVMDAAGWDTARMLGISFGGMVALELAVTSLLGSSGWSCCARRPGVAEGRPSPCTSWRASTRPSGSPAGPYCSTLGSTGSGWTAIPPTGASWR